MHRSLANVQVFGKCSVDPLDVLVRLSSGLRLCKIDRSIVQMLPKEKVELALEIFLGQLEDFAFGSQQKDGPPLGDDMCDIVKRSLDVIRSFHEARLESVSCAESWQGRVHQRTSEQ
jgi:hypothetical protein